MQILSSIYFLTVTQYLISISLLFHTFSLVQDFISLASLAEMLQLEGHMVQIGMHLKF